MAGGAHRKRRRGRRLCAGGWQKGAGISKGLGEDGEAQSANVRNANCVGVAQRCAQFPKTARRPPRPSAAQRSQMCVRWPLIFPLRMWRCCAGHSRGNIACKSRRPERRRRPRRPLPGPCAVCVFGPLSLATKKERLVQHAVIVYGAFPAAGVAGGAPQTGPHGQKERRPLSLGQNFAFVQQGGTNARHRRGRRTTTDRGAAARKKSTHAGPTVHGFLKGTDTGVGNPLQSPLISQIFDPAAGSLSPSPAPVSL